MSRKYTTHLYLSLINDKLVSISYTGVLWFTAVGLLYIEFKPQQKKEKEKMAMKEKEKKKKIGIYLVPCIYKDTKGEQLNTEEEEAGGHSTFENAVKC